MGLRIAIGICCFMAWFNVASQQINVGSSRAIGIVYQDKADVFDNNQSYNFQFRSSFRPLAIGMEFRTIDWGNQIGISLLYNNYKTFNERWGLQYDIGMIHSIALFRPGFKYSIGLLGRTSLAYQLNEKHRIEFGVALRYDKILAYNDFGAINQTLELPIHLSITRQLFPKMIQE